jgi:hypothetical protein
MDWKKLLGSPNHTKKMRKILVLGEEHTDPDPDPLKLAAIFYVN